MADTTLTDRDLEVLRAIRDGHEPNLFNESQTVRSLHRRGLIEPDPVLPHYGGRLGLHATCITEAGRLAVADMPPRTGYQEAKDVARVLATLSRTKTRQWSEKDGTAKFGDQYSVVRTVSGEVRPNDVGAPIVRELIFYNLTPAEAEALVVDWCTETNRSVPPR